MPSCRVGKPSQNLSWYQAPVCALLGRGREGDVPCWPAHAAVHAVKALQCQSKNMFHNTWFHVRRPYLPRRWAKGVGRQSQSEQKSPLSSNGLGRDRKCTGEQLKCLLLQFCLIPQTSYM